VGTLKAASRDVVCHALAIAGAHLQPPYFMTPKLRGLVKPNHRDHGKPLPRLYSRLSRRPAGGTFTEDTCQRSSAISLFLTTDPDAVFRLLLVTACCAQGIRKMVPRAWEAGIAGAPDYRLCLVQR